MPGGRDDADLRVQSPHGCFVVHHQHQFPAALRERLVRLFGGCGFRGVAGRQEDLEMRAAPELALDVDEAAVTLDNAHHRGQAQPRSLAYSLGGEIRIVDLIQVFWRDALAGVRDTQAHVAPRPGAGCQPGEQLVQCPSGPGGD